MNSHKTYPEVEKTSSSSHLLHGRTAASRRLPSPPFTPYSGADRSLVLLSSSSLPNRGQLPIRLPSPPVPPHSDADRSPVRLCSKARRRTAQKFAFIIFESSLQNLPNTGFDFRCRRRCLLTHTSTVFETPVRPETLKSRLYFTLFFWSPPSLPRFVVTFRHRRRRFYPDPAPSDNPFWF
ncbi:LIMR family protein [Gossypium australe]|uniref:LIMR family protein n=1 Tax=Gossypium australe TaxID=47621 RepID=A0A5B6W1H7_9ROSI|nr:LIMR family protein [Gossypium australe]